jgi:hypothetical protein
MILPEPLRRKGEKEKRGEGEGKVLLFSPFLLFSSSPLRS